MNRSESLSALAPALAAVQLHLEPVTKDRTNPHFRNRYATLDAIMEAVRGPLAGSGLMIVQGGDDAVYDNDGNIVGVSVETMILHSSGEFISSSFAMPLDKPTAQALGSCVTYGRRYGVSAVLGLSTEEDDDGNHATANQENAAVTRPKAVASAPPANEPTCPKCSGAMWDNRANKKNPSAPDWKCKNAPKERGGAGCDGVIWPPKAVA